MDDFDETDLDQYQKDENKIDFLSEIAASGASTTLQDFVGYISKNWKSGKCPPDTRKVVKRTSDILKSILPDNHYIKERNRRFNSVESSGSYSVPWRAYAELGTIELHLSRLILQNLVPAFQLLDGSSIASTKSQEKLRIKRAKAQARLPAFIYPFPEERQFAEFTGYDVIKESLEFMSEISEDLKNPKKNLQETYERKKREFEYRKEHRPKGMVFIPFKPVDSTATQEIVEAEVEKFSTKLRAIIDIVNTLLHLDSSDVQSKFPLSRLAMVRLKHSKNVGIPKSSKPSTCKRADQLVYDPEALTNAAKVFGRPEPIWQNKYKVTGIRQFSEENTRYQPYELINQLRGVLLRELEKVRSAGTHLLKRLETGFDRRYKYTSIALSSLPLIFLQQSDIKHYAEYLQSIVDKTAFAKGKADLFRGDKDLSLYLLGELDEDIRNMLEIKSDDKESETQEIPRAMWFQMLEKEADQSGILREPRIQALLEKIYQIHNVNLSKLKHVHEKFCLLITSAPMEEVCAPHWQMAAKFIHEHIMEAPEGMIDYWLAERGVPSFIKRRGLRSMQELV